MTRPRYNDPFKKLLHASQIIDRLCAKGLTDAQKKYLAARLDEWQPHTETETD